MTRPVWVDHILPPKPPKTVEVERRAFWLRLARESCRVFCGLRRRYGLPTDAPSDNLRHHLELLGDTLVRDLGCAPPPRKPCPYNPTGLILKGGGAGPFADAATTPAYRERT
jgi:hypothetical protein